MPKRRYSEDFYSEIDALIKIHQEKSTKRFEVMEIVQNDDNGGKKSESGYKPPPSFWAIASKNQLLKYALIFIGVIILTLAVSTTISGRMEQKKLLEAKDNGVVIITNKKTPETRKKDVDLSSYHQNLEVSVKPVPKNWGKPQGGILKPYEDDKDKLKEITDKPFEPERKGIEKPDIIMQKEEFLKGPSPMPGSVENEERTPDNLMPSPDNIKTREQPSDGPPLSSEALSPPTGESQGVPVNLSSSPGDTSAPEVVSNIKGQSAGNASSSPGSASEKKAEMTDKKKTPL